MLGKPGGALRANKTVRVATHMTAARYEANLRLPFRICRISDMYAPHYNRPMILSPFWLADKKILVIG